MFPDKTRNPGILIVRGYLRETVAYGGQEDGYILGGQLAETNYVSIDPSSLVMQVLF